jgi:hypothetical protein
MLERSGLREDSGQVRGGEEDPFPILVTLCAKRELVRNSRKDKESIVLYLEQRAKGQDTPKDTLALRNTAGGLRSVSEHFTISAWEMRNWRGQSPGSLRDRLRKVYRRPSGGDGSGDERARASTNSKRSSRGPGVRTPLHPRRSLGHTHHPTRGDGEREVRASCVDRQARARLWPGLT